MNINEVAQWVIDNRYPKSEFEKLSDHELYHGLIEKIELVLKQNSGNTNVLRSLELIDKMYEEETEVLSKAIFKDGDKKERHINRKYCLAIVKELIAARQPMT